MAYSTEAEVRALLGNLRNQIDQATILAAIDSADAQINRMTFRSDWSIADTDYSAIKKASRYLAAAECMVNINGTEPTQQRLWDEAMLIIQNITKFDTSNVTGDFVSSSKSTTYPMNPLGIIYASSRFPRLRKTNTDNQQIDRDFYWVNGYP
jgi:hypothetical protein